MSSPIRADWRTQAACIGRPLTIALCRTCPVQTQCLDWALGLDPYEDPDEIAGGYTRVGRGRLRVAGQPAATKRCPGCGEDKDRSEYAHVSRGGLDSRCRPCKAVQAAIYYRRAKAKRETP